jgi:hypothetical protein
MAGIIKIAENIEAPDPKGNQVVFYIKNLEMDYVVRQRT